MAVGTHLNSVVFVFHIEQIVLSTLLDEVVAVSPKIAGLVLESAKRN
jgi:hypothetical protein